MLLPTICDEKMHLVAAGANSGIIRVKRRRNAAILTNA
jgi:hypothetical protein